MLEDVINNMSTLMGIDTTVIPMIISVIVIIGIVYISLKGQLTIFSLLGLYALSMAVLSFLGIESVINIFTLFKEVVS